MKGILNIDSWSSMALTTHLNWWIGDLEIIYILNISELTYQQNNFDNITKIYIINDS